MVAMEYEEESVNPETGLIETRVWRAIFNDEEAAVSQAGQDVAEGRNPVRVVEWTEPSGSTPRTVARTATGKILLDFAELRKRATEVGTAF